MSTNAKWPAGRLVGLAAVIVLALATACGGGDSGYPDDFDGSFLATCYDTSGGLTSSCSCALDKVHDRYETYAEFLSNYDESELAILAADCLE